LNEKFIILLEEKDIVVQLLHDSTETLTKLEPLAVGTTVQVLHLENLQNFGLLAILYHDGQACVCLLCDKMVGV
jgi:hypothetical protein